MSRTPPRPDSGLYQDWKSWAGELLRYLEERERQRTDEARYQLATHPSTDLPSAAQEGLLLFKPDTLRVSVSFSNDWHDLAALDQANTFTAQQLFQLDSASAVPVIICSAEDSATGGPYLILDRASPSAATNDVGAGVLFRGRNAAGEIIDYGNVFLGILNATDGTESGQIVFNLYNSGSIANNFSVGNGVRIGVPTSGFLGAGRLNCAGAYYINGLQVVRARFTGWSTATGTPTRTSFDTATVTLPELAERVKALIDDLHATAGHGLIGT